MKSRAKAEQKRRSKSIQHIEIKQSHIRDIALGMSFFATVLDIASGLNIDLEIITPNDNTVDVDHEVVQPKQIS